MFESIGRRSGASPTRRLGGFLIAAAVHGGALALALFATRAPIIDVIQVPEGPPHVYRPRPGPPTNTTLVQLPQGQKPRPGPRPPRPPRHEPKPVDVDPAPPAPVVSELPAPIAEPAGPIGEGIGTGTPGTVPGVACPAGQVCTSIGERAPDEILSFTPGAMERPRPNCEPPNPLAPAAAAQYGLEGSVVTRYVVYSDGHVGDVRVLNSDAPPIFAQAVRDWLEGCQFVAGRLQDRPVAVRISQTFRFKTR
jgi:TonB family protein